MISIIVALDENNLIGCKNSLPWYLPADLKYFKETTTNHTVVMGRKTFESIGKPLPNRRNIVLSSRSNFKKTGVEVVNTIDHLFSIISEGENVFIIGGAEIYRQMLPITDRLYITRIHHAFEGDTYFPMIHEENWELLREKNGIQDERNQYPFSFLIYERINR